LLLALMSDWFDHMRRGDMTAAWDVSDRILRERAGVPCWHLPRHLQYVWNGEPVAGRHVLVRCYHGLGDTIQFVRFLPQLQSLARTVTLWTQPRLIPLLRHAAGIDAMLPLHDGEVGVDYDVDVEIMELPHVLRTTIETLPARVPYLSIDPAPLPGRRPAIGLVWRAGDWAEHRSIPFAELAPITTLDANWFVLQGGPGLEERPRDFGTLAGTTVIVELARVMRSLDLVITVDTMAAHLAGALGVPVWTLLHADADWRWMTGRSDSPWYPTMRLFRQERPGDWPPVIARVKWGLSPFLGAVVNA
jgi:hypothetical protein